MIMVFQLQLSIKQGPAKNLTFSPKCSTCYKKFKFSVFTLQCTMLGENYSRKLMHGVMKVKRINVGETKIGTILGEIKPEAQKRGRTLPATR